MYHKYVISIIFIFSLLALVACGPAALPNAEQNTGAPAPADEVTVAPTATPAEETADEATAEPSDEETADAEALPEADSKTTPVQELDWGDDKEDCKIPGLVISGTVSSDAPCSPAVEATSEAEGDGEDATEEPAPQMDEQMAELDPQAEEAATLAVEDLAQELGISSDEIEVAGVSAVDWPDASLGCPEPDMMYAQVVTPGHIVHLRVDGASYYYHSGGMQSPFLCEETLQQLPPGLEMDTTE